MHVKRNDILPYFISKQNPTQIATALQAFYNLGDFYGPMRRNVDDLTAAIRVRIKEGLDRKSLVAAAAVNNASKLTVGNNQGKGNVFSTRQLNSRILFAIYHSTRFTKFNQK